MVLSSANSFPLIDANKDNKEIVRDLFLELTASYGIDGAPIFERLAAGKNLGEALLIAPEIVETLYSRAHSWFSLGRIDRALILFRALCVLDNSDANYWIGYGVCLRMVQQSDSAWRAFQTASLLRPEWAIPHFHALELALVEKQWERADACLKAYEERADSNIPAGIDHEMQRLRVVLETHSQQQS